MGKVPTYMPDALGPFLKREKLWSCQLHSPNNCNFWWEDCLRVKYYHSGGNALSLITETAYTWDCTMPSLARRLLPQRGETRNILLVARSSCIVLALEVPPTLKLILPPSTNSLKFIVESIRKISINDRLPRSRPLSYIKGIRDRYFVKDSLSESCFVWLNL